MSRSKKLRHPDRSPKNLPVSLVKTPLPGKAVDRPSRLLRAEAKKAGRRVMRRRLQVNPLCGHTFDYGVKAGCRVCLEEVYVD